MSAMIAVVAVIVDWMFGETRRWHPLVGFGRYAGMLEVHFQAPHASTAWQRWEGALAVAVAIVPITVCIVLLDRVLWLKFLVGVIALYLAIGHRSLREHALDVHAALNSHELPRARSKLARMVSRDTANMDAQSIAIATVESVLENGNDAIFGALFWFALMGAPGAIGYRLSNTLDAMWGYRTERYLHFGWAAARLDDVLNYIPARLTGLSYALLGDTGCALRCWREQAPAWESPNAGPVMAAGAGALKLSLGGGASYQGILTKRSPLGTGQKPEADAILRALTLVSRTLTLWLSLFLIVGFVIHA